MGDEIDLVYFQQDGAGFFCVLSSVKQSVTELGTPKNINFPHSLLQHLSGWKF